MSQKLFTIAELFEKKNNLAGCRMYSTTTNGIDTRSHSKFALVSGPLLNIEKIDKVRLINLDDTPGWQYKLTLKNEDHDINTEHICDPEKIYWIDATQTAPIFCVEIAIENRIQKH